MKNLFRFVLSGITIVLLTLSSCVETPPPSINIPDPFEDLVLIGQSYAFGSGSFVRLYAEEELFVGYNNIYAYVVDSNNVFQVLTDITVTFNPLMDMGTMLHSCPVEQPGAVIEPSTRSFKGAVVFIMPTTAGTWNLNVQVDNPLLGKTGIASIPVIVKAPIIPRLLSFVSDYDSAQTFVALIQPTDPVVGMNNLELGIYEKESMMSFPGVDDMIVKMDPEMPATGLGSTNNMDPITEGNGHYVGKVNLTMAGYWKINLDFVTSSSDTVKTNQFFELDF